MDRSREMCLLALLGAQHLDNLRAFDQAHDLVSMMNFTGGMTVLRGI